MIHCYQLLGQNMVVDVYSGSVHVMDKTAYLLSKYFEENGFLCSMDKESFAAAGITDTIAGMAAYEEIVQLKEDGLLMSDDCYEPYAASWHKGSVIKAVCIHIAHDCNLRCKYCFADTGEFCGARSMMSMEVGRKTIDYVIVNSKGRKNIEVDFFGGEPLMNFEVVKDIVAYAKSEGEKAGKHFRFTITTNGLLLDDEKIAYINQNMVNIVLSIDGRKSVNDKMRYRADGSGCYDKIVPIFLKVAKSREQDNYYVRGTYTRENLDFAADVLHLADLGFKQISVEPVVAPDEMDYSLQMEHLPILFSQYEQLAEEYIRRKKEGIGFSFFHFMVDLDQGPCVIKRMSGCGSGHEYIAVTPDGDIYPCHQFVGDEKMKMGDVFSGIQNHRISEMFEGSHVYTKPECKKCWAKFYCSGGCPANAWNFNGDINMPYEIGCHLQRKRVECAIAITAACSENV